MLKRNLAKSVTSSPLNKNLSWPPPPIGRGKNTRKRLALPPLVDPSTVTVLGQVESGKGDPSDRGESTPKKKKTSHKSPKKSAKSSKVPEYQSDVKNLDEKWSDRFARLEALFLSKTFQLLVEPVQSSSVVVSDKPFIPPEQQSSSQIPTASASGKKKATQPVEAPGALPAPGATGEFQPTSQDVRPPAAVSASGQPEVQPPGPTAQLAFAANRSTSLTGVPTSQDEPVSDEDQLSDHPSPSLDEEGELSGIQSTGPDQEELLDVD